MGIFRVWAWFALAPVHAFAQETVVAPPFLEEALWGSAPLCGPEAELNSQSEIDSYDGAVPLVYLDQYGLGHAAAPVYCSFHTIHGGPMAEEGVYVAHLVCAGAEGFDALVTLAVIYQGATVGETTARIGLRDQAGRLDQDLFLCPEPR